MVYLMMELRVKYQSANVCGGITNFILIKWYACYITTRMCQNLRRSADKLK